MVMPWIFAESEPRKPHDLCHHVYRWNIELDMQSLNNCIDSISHAQIHLLCIMDQITLQTYVEHRNEFEQLNYIRNAQAAALHYAYYLRSYFYKVMEIHDENI